MSEDPKPIPNTNEDQHVSDLQHAVDVPLPYRMDRLPRDEQMERRLDIARDTGRVAAKFIKHQKEALEGAKIDALTGMRSATTYEEEFEDAINQAKVDQTAVVFVDVANLGITNDTYGHAVGNKYLRTVSQTLLSATRPNDVWYRVGGDEFVGILNGTNGGGTNQPQDKSNLELFRDTQARMRELTKEALQESDLPEGLFTGVGIGLAIKRDGDTPEMLIQVADAAMEVDKQNLYKQSGVERRSK